MDSLLQDAKRWCLGHSGSAVESVVRVRYEESEVSVSVQQLMSTFNKNNNNNNNNMLDVSVEGQQHAALEAHLQTALSELLQLHHHLTVARGLLALADAARHLYPLSVLHHAPELLTATATATATSSSTSSSFDALLFVCPAAFPYCGQQSDRRMEVLRLHMIAEDLYALAAAGDECNRAPTLHKALEHCIAAQQLVPDNAMINLRTASILSKLGRRNEAVQMLKQQHDRTPHVGKIFWQIGVQLYHEQHYKKALGTIYGGVVKTRIHETRFGPKIHMLARRCVLHVFGTACFGTSAPTLVGQNVLQLVMSKVSFWDILRMAQVCFVWSVYASSPIIWRTLIQKFFGETDLNHALNSGASLKEAFRLLLIRKKSCLMRCEGIVLLGRHAQWFKGFYTFRPECADVPRMAWLAFVAHLRRLGFDPALFPLIKMSWNTSRSFQPHKRFSFSPLAPISLLPMMYCSRSLNHFWLVPSRDVPGIWYCAACENFTDAPLYRTDDDEHYHERQCGLRANEEIRRVGSKETLHAKAPVPNNMTRLPGYQIRPYCVVSLYYPIGEGSDSLLLNAPLLVYNIPKMQTLPDNPFACPFATPNTSLFSLNELKRLLKVSKGYMAINYPQLLGMEDSE